MVYVYIHNYIIFISLVIKLIDYSFMEYDLRACYIISMLYVQYMYDVCVCIYMLHVWHQFTQ